jgi:precorrin-2/cobalt-factor-2 C20-methyltransferase
MTAYVIGVGPGDPELLTLRAARMLERCDTVLHAGPRDDAGFAYEVVAPLLHPRQTVRGMALVMRRGIDSGSVGYDRVAHTLAQEARAGRVAAFLTEGDPMLFGTGSHVVERLRAEAPDVAVEIVPGVSALGAAAAKLGWPLAEKGEILTICPATYHPDELGHLLDRPGAICFLKAADVLPRLVEELRQRGRLERAALVERVGRPEERIIRDLASAQAGTFSYFSLVLVR